MEINKIYNMDCLEGMKQMKDESVDIVITSPPYFNLRDYSQYTCYEDYLCFIREIATELLRVLKKGRHIFWNIQHAIPSKTTDKDSERNMYPLTADTEKIFMEVGLLFEGQIIWDKGIAGATQKMFGSYPYPPTIIPSFRTEDILVFKKSGKPDLSKKKESEKITKDDWVNIATNLWNFETVRVVYDNKLEGNIKHSAPFPEKLVYNCLKCWSFSKDLILDPFMGSGTTAIVSIKNNRNFIGFEKNEEYFKLCNKRILPYLEQCSLNSFVNCGVLEDEI